MSYNIALIYGSVRSERIGIKAADYFYKRYTEEGNTVTMIDPKIFKVPMIDKMYLEYKNNDAPEPLGQLHDIFEKADGFLIVTGEYNHSIPPALTNLMDHFRPEFLYKPSAIVSYSAGIFGGVRAAVQLRSFLSELGTSSIPSTFPIGRIQDAFDENMQPTIPDFEKSYQKFTKEFYWYLDALKTAREKK